MPSTAQYQRADASGSFTYSTTCATRMILGMSMCALQAWRRRGRQPCDIGDLAEFAPLLAPADTAVDAAEQIPVLGTRQHEIRIGGMGADGPDRGIRLHGKRRMDPVVTAIDRSQEHRRRPRRSIADTQEQLTSTARLSNEHPRIVDTEGLPDVRFPPGCAIVDRGVDRIDHQREDR